MNKVETLHQCIGIPTEIINKLRETHPLLFVSPETHPHLFEAPAIHPHIFNEPKV